MDSLLDISSSRRNIDAQETNTFIVAKAPQPEVKAEQNSPTLAVNSAAEVLEILRDQPSFEQLRLCLKWLIRPNQDFDIKTPAPLTTQIIAVLVSDVIPSYWSILRGDQHSKEKQGLLKCLASITGIGALIARLRYLQNSNANLEVTHTPIDGSKSVDILEVLDAILQGDLVLFNMWVDLNLHVKKSIRQQILWKEVISLLASGRVVSVAAEALVSLKDRESQYSWLGESSSFTAWLGTNIRRLALMSSKHGNEVFAPAASMLGRALSLGHNGLLPLGL